jgi:ribokinase
LNLDLLVPVARLPARGETILASGPTAKLPGGKGANQAVAAARQGALTAMVGAVGADDDGATLLEATGGAGVDLTHVARLADTPTGLAVITVDAAGDNTIVVAANANGALTPAAVERASATIATARVVLVQLEVPLDAVAAALALARRHGVVTVLNPAPAAALPDEVLAASDYVVPNETEAAALTGIATDSDDGATEAARRLLARGAGSVVVTLGARGALTVDLAETRRIAAFAVTAVDATAAGDAFCGTFAAALACGAAPADALRRASAAGALACTVRGALPSLPDAAAVDALLAAQG